jgi:inner membrane protein
VTTSFRSAGIVYFQLSPMAPPRFGGEQKWTRDMRNSAIARLGVMGVLTLALLVPLTMVLVTVSERSARRDEAVREVSGTWGAPQTFGGPVLSVPYVQQWVDANGKQQRSWHRAHLLGTRLQIDGTVTPERRRRGIFEVIVYRAQLKVSGRFVRPTLEWLKVTPDQIQWDQASLSIGVADPKGIATRGSLNWNGRTLALTPDIADVGLFASGIQAAVPSLETIPAGTDIPFELILDVNGTRELRFLPTAEETNVNLTSAWPHPSFAGAPLPQSRTTSDAGFTAHWLVTDLGRAYRQQWTSQGMDRDQLAARGEASAFGVILLQPVDIYQQAERAVKYAILFIVLTFLVFFLWEVFQATLLHPMQYAFVGFALCLFYLLLVSISEHTGFDTAYLVSSSAATLLIGGYSRAVLKGTRQAASVVGSLSGLYGFLYLLLRLEDYALLAGSIGMFLVLAFVMFITRRMDWYNLRLGAARDA